MEATALLQATSHSSTQRPVQLVLVRANAPLFYSVAAASLLESGTPLAADRLLHFFGSDPVLDRWVRHEWLPRKLARTAQLRDYITVMWPEFDWMAGHEQYRAAADGRATPLRPTGAHEALARCVATAQSGIFYRTLARWAEDPRLRALARVMAEEEAASFTQFRRLYDTRLRAQGFGCATAWTTALGCVRSARDAQVPRAFDAIVSQCPPNSPFPTLDYAEFVTRMGSVIERHGNLGTPERVLFHTWRAQPRVRAPRTDRRSASWFTPVLRPA